MKRLLLCTSCIVAMLTVVVAVVMALGVELIQKAQEREWREAMAQ